MVLVEAARLGHSAVLVEAEDVCAVSARRASAPFAVVMVPAP